MKKLLLTTLLVVTGLVLILLAWGLAEPYTLDEQVFTVALPDLPAAWDGQEVAVVGDLQVGMWLDNTATIAKAVDRLIQHKPAAVLIVGDFVYHRGTNAGPYIRQAAGLLEPLTRAGLEVYAVLGNHDYAVTRTDRVVDQERAEQVQAALEGIGIQVLSNEAVSLSPVGGSQAGAESLYLVGIDSHMAAQADLQAALADVPDQAARLVFMHHPDTFAGLPAGAAPLAVAGHTHGGQVRIPFAPEWSLLTLFKEGEAHVDGWIEDYGQGDNQLYVNRGIGFSAVPIRINCPPELTFFTLTPEQVGQAKSAAPAQLPGNPEKSDFLEFTVSP